MEWYTSNDVNPTSLNTRSFSQQYTYKVRNGEAKLLALSGAAKKRTIDQTRHYWFVEQRHFVNAVVDSAALAADTTLTLVSTYGLVKRQVLQAKRTFIAGVYQPVESIRITAVLSATQIQVERGFSGTTPADIPLNTILHCIGTAFEEASDGADTVSSAPVEYENFTAIARNAWGISGTLKAMGVEVGPEHLHRNKSECMRKHALEMEMQYLFSRKSNTIDVLTGRPIRTMNGIEALIEESAPANIMEAPASTTFKQFRDMLAKTTKIKKEGQLGYSGSKIIYCGQDARLAIHDIMDSTGVLRIEHKVTSIGQRYDRLITPVGEFMLMEHTLFNEHTGHETTAMIVDPNFMDILHLKGRDGEVRSVNSSNNLMNSASQQDAESGIITSESTLELVAPEACGMIYNLGA